MFLFKDNRALNKEYPFEIERFCANRIDNAIDSFHWHAFFEITFVESGCGFYYVNGREFYMESGDIIIFNHMEPHGWKVVEETMNLLVMMFSSDFIADPASFFDYDYLRCFVERGSHFVNKISKSEVYTSEIHNILLEILEENHNLEVGYRLMTKANVLRILTILSRHYRKQEHQEHSLSKRRDELKRLEQAFLYIKENYTKKITLKETAQIACMSPTYFSSYFKKVTNQNFQDYLAQLRIHKANELLLNTSLGILDVAQQCGFHNISNFYKLFKKYKGCTPREVTKDNNKP